MSVLPSRAMAVANKSACWGATGVSTACSVHSANSVPGVMLGSRVNTVQDARTLGLALEMRVTVMVGLPPVSPLASPCVGECQGGTVTTSPQAL